jgi:hypothetical protein
MFTIENFPLPPSVNEYLAIVKGRQIKTRVHRQYSYACRYFYLENKNKIDAIKNKLIYAMHGCFDKNITFALHIDYIFHFERSRILTKKNQAKVLDASNRLKPCADQFASMIKIDDKYFFSESCRKTAVGEKAKECTTIIITQIQL